MNSAALRTPALLDALDNALGCQCITLSIDAAAHNGQWDVYQRAGTEPTGRDAVAWAREGADRGAGEILLTSIDRDGTREGYDLALTRAVSTAVTVPVVASGGARSVADLAAGFEAGADAVLAASMFHDRDITIGSVKQLLRDQGVSVRL